MRLSKAVQNTSWTSDRFVNKRQADLNNLAVLNRMLRKPKARFLTLPGPEWRWEEQASQVLGCDCNFVGVEINAITHAVAATTAVELGMSYRMHPRATDVADVILHGGYGEFDVVYFDFTGPLTGTIRAALWALWETGALPVGGVLMLTMLMRRQPGDIMTESALMENRPSAWRDPELVFIRPSDDTDARRRLTFDYVDSICGDAARMGVLLEPRVVQLYANPGSVSACHRVPLGQFMFTRTR